MALVAGVDGCPGGWVAAVVDGEEGGAGVAGVEWRLLPLSFAAMLDGLADCVRIAVDVPIGMPETDHRRCDLAARRLLRPASSSVFAVPPRRVLEAASHKAACEVGRGLHGMAISVQTWQIRGRVLDATDTVTDHARVVEAHPEVSFRLMTERVLPTKHSAPGLGERIAALGEHFGNVLALLRDCPAPARADDALDALACAWTARRVLTGTAITLPHDAPDGAPVIVA
jgi:predicted RNase H-like nuclease